MIGNPFTGLPAGRITFDRIEQTMNPWEFFGPALQIATAIGGAIAGALTQLASGQAITVAPIRTYIGKLHVEIDVAVKVLPPP